MVFVLERVPRPWSAPSSHEPQPVAQRSSHGTNRAPGNTSINIPARIQYVLRTLSSLVKSTNGGSPFAAETQHTVLPHIMRLWARALLRKEL